MDKIYVIHSTPNYPHWKEIFHFYLNHCTCFEIHYPDGPTTPDNPLTVGREEFRQLPDITIGAWSGMENSIQIKGKLNEKSISLFCKYTEDSFSGYRPSLWDYTLLKEGQPLLKVDDFTVCSLSQDEGFIQKLKNEIGISQEELDQLILEP